MALEFSEMDNTTNTTTLRRPFWGRALRWSLPLSLLLQFMLPVLSSLAKAPSKGILCTASSHGARAVPCTFAQMIGEWIEYVPLSNLVLLGLPTLLSYVAVLVILLPFFYLLSKREEA